MKSTEYEWDLAKAEHNLRKHGVDFADAAVALGDPRAMTRHDPDSNGEARYVSLGMDRTGRVLVTVFSYPGARVRVISSRKATRSERASYGQRYA